MRWFGWLLRFFFSKNGGFSVDTLDCRMIHHLNISSMCMYLYIYIYIYTHYFMLIWWRPLRNTWSIFFVMYEILMCIHSYGAHWSWFFPRFWWPNGEPVVESSPCSCFCSWKTRWEILCSRWRLKNAGKIIGELSIQLPATWPTLLVNVAFRQDHAPNPFFLISAKNIWQSVK